MRKKKELTPIKKLLYLILGIVLLAALVYLGYYLVHYTFYDHYRDFLSELSASAPGEEFTPKGEALEGYRDYKLVAETDVLKLYCNPETTDVAVLDTRNGAVAFGVPENADDDPVANASNKQYLKSHLMLDYFNVNRAMISWDSWSMSVNRGQFSYEKLENGIRVIYTLGDFSSMELLSVPTYLTNEKFEEICSFLEDKEIASMSRYYSEDSDVPGMRQLLTSATKNRATVKKIEGFMERAGFTEEDLLEQMELSGYTVTIPPSITIALDYVVKDDYLEVSVPIDRIKEEGNASLYRLQVLRNFGAAASSEQGYIVVPNGDGSVINFNNGKSSSAVYSRYVYGIDPSASDYTVKEKTEEISMALFALCRENSSILATVEDGATLASITAGVSGKINDYNYAYVTYVLRGSETLEMFGTTGNEAALPILEPELYASELRVRYSFLTEQYAGYSGVANYYRSRLITEGILREKTEQDDIKFYCDVISGVEMTESFLGKQYGSLKPMTTFEEAGEIAESLNALGVRNQVMNLQGWFNHGYYHDVPDKLRIPLKLGGKRGLEALNEKLEEMNGTLYADVAFQKVTSVSSRFVFNTESAKYYASGYTLTFGEVHPVSLQRTSGLGYRDRMYDLISPKFLVRYTEAFTSKFSKLDVAGISLRDLGSEVHSDKKRTNIINREQALDVVVSQLELMKASGKKLLINESNDYAWAYADDIINLPLGDNEFVIVDYDIPLYEMIIHGAIDYCGEVFNLTDAKTDRIPVLNMIEYGAAPHFVFTQQESTEMKYSALNNAYSTTFAVWSEKAAEIYREVNGVLSRVSGQQMSAHEVLEGGIRKVTYGNGVSVYVNYSENELQADGITVPALGYAVKEAG